jgi:hypothetical protein
MLASPLSSPRTAVMLQFVAYIGTARPDPLGSGLAVSQKLQPHPWGNVIEEPAMSGKALSRPPCMSAFWSLSEGKRT